MTCRVIDSKPTRTDAGGMDGFWGSYAIAVIADLTVGPDVVEYLERIEDTLEPFGGRFLVHGERCERVEGAPLGEPVVIAFPSATGAQEWYRSDAYQKTAPLRSKHSRSSILLARGVDAAHRSAAVASALRRTSIL